MHTLFETYLGYYGIEWLRPLIVAHLNRFYRRADHVFAPTPALVASLQDLRNDTRASVWSRGIDRELFSPKKRNLEWRRANGIQDDEVAVLFFGRLVKEKGIDIYAEALSSLRHRSDVRALIVGEGPARSELETIDGAVLSGHLEGEELAMAVASADIMMAPSTTETFGQVMLEGMASGLPIVSADAPSARALLREEETGILCQPTAVAEYVNAAENLASDAARRHKMGSASRTASCDFSWDHASKSVADVYRDLLGNSG